MSYQSYPVAVLGGSAVGKTALCTRIINNTFSEEYTRTIGASFGSISYNEDKVTVWDLCLSTYFQVTHEKQAMRDITPSSPCT